MSTEEKNLSHESQRKEEHVDFMLGWNMQALKDIDSMFQGLIDLTTDTELEEALTLYIDDVIPVIRNRLNDK